MRASGRKYDGRFPYHAIHFCLDELGIALSDLDQVCFGEEGGQDPANPGYSVPLITPERIAQVLRAGFPGVALPPIRIVQHHLSHASATHALSGFFESLVLTHDGHGDLISTAIWTARGKRLERLAGLAPLRGSLGLLYATPLVALGYGYGDEYKVMGLAPYGDPAVYRDLVSRFVTLHDQGRFELDLFGLEAAIEERIRPPWKKGEFEQAHMDLAAATQEAFETCALHLLRHFQARTGLRRLCIGGGCGQNSTFNGKLAAAGLFDEIFVMPGTTDASLSVGAALTSTGMSR